ncbi:hypothetical protein AVDCRST_MAG82-2868 [uncultured Rubrobacteraceae bacterium]|uniref:DUF7282 domain-containing protein n=1 Tax=uncultured Rubrobacteraceae bacterium TaxID=349277 RepID=A0A6J4QIF3_9ACTN|nr:hypothetical protein AVDCRST_MAG82-2868 [uncultured Rubrobacteraceae bacterium]
MGRNRSSNEDAPRVPGEERSGRGRPVIWIVLGLILLLLLALVIPFACQALRGSEDQGSGGGGAGAQGGGAQEEANQGGKPNDKQDSARGANAQGSNGAKGTQPTGSGGSRGEVDAALADVGDRSGDGTIVTIPKAKLEGTKGWLAVHAGDGGKPGAVLGHAALKEGTNTGVRVKLDRPLGSSQRLYAVVHAEDPADGKYTFPDGDPSIVRNGKTTVEPLYYTIKNVAKGTPGGQAGVRGGLPESGGVPPAVLLVGGWALLLSSLACLFLALRQASTNEN